MSKLELLSRHMVLRISAIGWKQESQSRSPSGKMVNFLRQLLSKPESRAIYFCLRRPLRIMPITFAMPLLISLLVVSLFSLGTDVALCHHGSSPVDSSLVKHGMSPSLIVFCSGAAPHPAEVYKTRLLANSTGGSSSGVRRSMAERIRGILVALNETFFQSIS